jgi:hypothetical protein
VSAYKDGPQKVRSCPPQPSTEFEGIHNLDEYPIAVIPPNLTPTRRILDDGFPPDCGPQHLVEHLKYLPCLFLGRRANVRGEWSDNYPFPVYEVTSGEDANFNAKILAVTWR